MVPAAGLPLPGAAHAVPRLLCAAMSDFRLSKWVWVKIKPPGIGPQVLVHVSIYQGSIVPKALSMIEQPSELLLGFLFYLGVFFEAIPFSIC